MPGNNERIADLFSEWADLIQIAGGDAFRARAFEKAARSVGGHPKDVAELDVKALKAIPSIGEGMARRIREYAQTGSIQDLEELRELVPAGLRELMRVPGLGPKKAALVHRELGISSLEDLVTAIRARRLRAVKGLGAKTEENLLRGIRNLKAHGERMLLDVAARAAEEIIAALRDHPAVEEIAAAGSLRRMCETIGDIDILVASEDPEPVMETLASLEIVSEVIARGETKTSVLTEAGPQVDCRVLPLEDWGAGLVYFTGSKAHNIRIREIAVRSELKLSEYGLFRTRDGRRLASRTEQEVYDALGLPWIPPPMREDSGEIEAALAGSLPQPVAITDLRGDLHGHTDLTDGVASLEEMIAAAAGRGYAYYAVTDHAENLHMTGMQRDQVLAQRTAIGRLQRRYPKMRILHGTELNIGRDGGVDYDPEFLAGFDVTVASVHSHFRLSREEMTRRVIRAMENPFVNIIGHPTGRVISRRAPIELDLEAVCDAAVRTGTALEVNAFPDRLDLRDEHVRFAVERGVTVAISTDSHATPHLENMRFGVATAQRGWLPKAQTLNARTARQIETFVERKRDRG